MHHNKRIMHIVKMLFFSTNIPKEAMAFQGFPFPADLPSFMKHQDVLKYLQNFAEHYGLHKYIQVGREYCSYYLLQRM